MKRRVLSWSDDPAADWERWCDMHPEPEEDNVEIGFNIQLKVFRNSEGELIPDESVINLESANIDAKHNRISANRCSDTVYSFDQLEEDLEYACAAKAGEPGQYVMVGTIFIPYYYFEDEEDCSVTNNDSPEFEFDNVTSL